MKTRLFIVKTPAELERCFSIMKELRPHLNIEQYKEIYKHAHTQDGYEIAVLQEHEEVVALMGYRILWDMVRGKYIYIDDLVSSEHARSKGYGAELLKYAEKIARENQCTVLRLCAVFDNHRGLQFYDREGWTKRAFALTKKVDL